MVRFVHTSDWQLGMTRHFLGVEAQARYTAARIDAIRSIGAVAARERCDFVVVAGDVFESNLVAPQTVRRALEAMAAIELPVYLLPGNHDPLDAVSVYRSRLFERACPGNVRVLDTPGVVSVGAGVDLVAAPWFSKAPLSDAVALAIAEVGDPDESRLRVLVGHGALDVLTPDADDPAAISLAALEDALDRGVIHYAALGDKHTRLAMGRRRLIHYSGSPEVTSFREELPGDVLVVDVDPHRPAQVTPHHVGTWRFVTLERELSGGADLDELDATLGALDPKDRTVVRTGLQGALTLHEKARLDAMLDAYAEVLAGCFDWQHHHDIAVILADGELTDLGVGGFVEAAVADLAGLAHRRDREARSRVASPGGAASMPRPADGAAAAGGPEPGPDAATARDALSLLLRLAKGPAA